MVPDIVPGWLPGFWDGWGWDLIAVHWLPSHYPTTFTVGDTIWFLPSKNGNSPKKTIGLDLELGTSFSPVSSQRFTEKSSIFSANKVMSIKFGGQQPQTPKTRRNDRKGSAFFHARLEPNEIRVMTY